MLPSALHLHPRRQMCLPSRQGGLPRRRSRALHAPEAQVRARTQTCRTGHGRKRTRGPPGAAQRRRPCSGRCPRGSAGSIWGTAVPGCERPLVVIIDTTTIIIIIGSCSSSIVITTIIITFITIIITIITILFTIHGYNIPRTSTAKSR